VPAGHVVAHGSAQLGGFVGLFVVGIALRYLPMTTSRPRPGRPLRRFILGALLAGVAGGFAWALAPGPLAPLGPASGGALLAGAAAFLVFVIRQVSGKLRAPWARLVLASGLWLAGWAASTLALRTAAAGSGPGSFAEEERQLLMVLAIFGFALNAIYGFGLKLLSGFLGTPSPRPGAAEAVFWLHNLGVLALVLADAVPAVPG
jgi:hypothetical protein